VIVILPSCGWSGVAPHSIAYVMTWWEFGLATMAIALLRLSAWPSSREERSISAYQNLVHHVFNILILDALR